MNAGHDQLSFEFCQIYLNANPDLRYVLGRNVYTESIIGNISICGVVDDYTNESSFCGVPVVKTTNLGKDSLVVNASGGRPFTAKTALDKKGIRNLDYFSFYRHSGLALRDVVFNEGFSEDYVNHKADYEWIFTRLSDQISKDVFSKLVGFRNTLDINYLNGFYYNEPAQYFDDILNLSDKNETFVDIGCFNGFNSLEFARLVPGYRAIYAFEPDPLNFRKCEASLSNLRNVYLQNIGLADSQTTLRMSQGGSGSKINPDGTVEIHVDRLDNFKILDPTFIKMDIEGVEVQAIQGARETIAKAHPRLAICVYHNVGDFYRIPQLVLGIRDDYDVYIRHYTETIYETVMFFIPRK